MCDCVKLYNLLRECALCNLEGSLAASSRAPLPPLPSPPQWGYNNVYQLAQNTSTANSAKPIMVIGTDPAWLRVSSGNNFVCTSSDVVTPVSFLPPGSPTIANATVGSHTITVTLTAPASNGTAPLSSYNVTCASDLGTTNMGGWEYPVLGGHTEHGAVPSALTTPLAL